MKPCQSYKEEYGIDDPDLTQLHYISLYPNLSNLEYRDFKVQICSPSTGWEPRSKTVIACCREHARDLNDHTVSVSLD